MLVCGNEVEPTDNPSGFTVAGIWTNMGSDLQTEFAREFCPSEFGLPDELKGGIRKDCLSDLSCAKCWGKACGEVY